MLVIVCEDYNIVSNIRDFCVGVSLLFEQSLNRAQYQLWNLGSRN